MAHTCYGMVSTSPEFKDWAKKCRQIQDDQRRKHEQHVQTEQRKAVTRTTAKVEKRSAKCAGKVYDEMTADEKRSIDNLMKKHNAEVRQMYGIQFLSPGAEIR